MNHDPGEVARGVAARWPDSLCVGCTTMGEIGPLGLTQGGISALALPPPARAAAVFADSRVGFADGERLAEALAGALGHIPAALDPERHVLVTLTDGLSGAEERLVAALGLVLPRVQLIGGSAGDDFRMQRTWVHLNGEARPGAAVVTLLEPGLPMSAFAVHHYQPGERRVVVTAAEPSRRRVLELDGWPAREVMAELLEVPVETLAAHPELPAERELAFAYAIGDDLFLRSVMHVDGDALVMGGAVEEGVVLRVVHGGDLVEATRAGVQEALARLPGAPGGMLLFSCGGRLRAAQRKKQVEALYEAMAQAPMAGFSTYGEQFGPLQINQTLTGLAIGRP
ncbi:MAG: FIST C-terminal domain-containing protein [Alphaproteobacteria bacterium]|nr:FIST C-terminal domain-containing protein [Alphaproteobacteria bacterium]